MAQNSPSYQENPHFLELRSSLKEGTSPFVFWIGAGTSAPAGYPLWPELRASVLAYCRQHIASIGDADTVSRFGAKLQAAERAPNGWTAFDIMNSAQSTTFESAVKRHLSARPKVVIPEALTLIWKLPVRGIVSLNLDPLAASAYANARPGERDLARWTGDRCGVYAEHLSTNRPFLAQIHGVIDDAATWVLTRSSLQRLQADPSFGHFTAACLTTFLNVFVGMSTDDEAIRVHLDRLRQDGVPLAGHYWVTDRGGADDVEFAEANRLKLIQYDRVDDSHVGLVRLLQNIADFRPADVEVPPAPPPAGVPEVAKRPLLSDLLPLESADEIRGRLNGYAKHVLSADTTTMEPAAYRDLWTDFAPVIPRAYFITETSPHNRFLGYEIEKTVAEGAFGVVYRATDARGSLVALKVMKPEFLPEQNRKKLSCFRRGVAALRILGSGTMPGIVKFIDSGEIPAFVAMEFVHGDSLTKFITESPQLSLLDRLSIAIRIAEIVRDAHQLPQRVLHRDLRPDNVIIREDGNGLSNRIVVLDFDLAWHKDATGESFAPGIGVYMSPEQILRSSRFSTRSAAVDVYGFSLLLYFILTGEHPMPLASESSVWAATVNASIRRKHSGIRWKSCPNRLARLVVRGSKSSANERPDLAFVLGELTEVRKAISREIPSPEHIAEEVLARAVGEMNYGWGDDAGGKVEVVAGRELQIFVDPNSGLVVARATWASTGVESLTGLSARLGAASRRIKERFTADRWTVRGLATRGNSLVFEATLDPRIAFASVDSVAATVDELRAAIGRIGDGG